MLFCFHFWLFFSFFSFVISFRFLFLFFEILNVVIVMKCLGFIFRHFSNRKKWTKYKYWIEKSRHAWLLCSHIISVIQCLILVCSCVFVYACDCFIHIVLNILFPSNSLNSLNSSVRCLFRSCLSFEFFRCLIFKYYFAIFCSSFFFFNISWLFARICICMRACSHFVCARQILATCWIEMCGVPHANSQFSFLRSFSKFKDLNKLSVFSGKHI